EVIWRPRLRQQQAGGDSHHFLDARGCVRQALELDDGIHQALRAQAALEFREGSRAGTQVLRQCSKCLYPLSISPGALCYS
ncbi:mCG146202, partial [Mus musculus]